MNLANEGLEARKKEEEVTQRKRKAEDDKIWEGALSFAHFCLCMYANIHPTETREQRVGTWRNFANSKKKKTKTKPNVLG